ncbi:hypothetical protein SBD_7859 [Streptomyces bottropensis ATCC 25435]|uniref:Uncharacterized protein n=1 Tax=Streptomyces bottropensis ATCC 25435 TaxID=1054862 RepID=M3FE95_9ACTN|nr:hypothetical protein SBD_7859 [Streptomyces bottropensis ATCC 25435]
MRTGGPFERGGVHLDRTQGGCPVAHPTMRPPPPDRSSEGNHPMSCMNSGVRPYG